MLYANRNPYGMNDGCSVRSPGKLASVIESIITFLKSMLRVSRIPMICTPSIGSPSNGMVVLCRWCLSSDVKMSIGSSMSQFSIDIAVLRISSMAIRRYSIAAMSSPLRVLRICCNRFDCYRNRILHIKLFFLTDNIIRLGRLT